MTKSDLIRKIKLILKHDNINKAENAGAKQGLEKALEILESNQRDLSGLDELDTTQAKAIAKFAIDFNNMKHNGEFFVALGESIEGKVPDEQFYKKLWKIMDEQNKKS
ncbi:MULTISPECIES: hypothetical protein [Dysgonomonas]|uniref:Uncharacterized protein n=1 Tax=Dysgonomonas gadei ATCC BAA-286 TaxID=742766 RepID=F5IXN8_9BACT|nr:MULTISPECIES: hypothetical protein [Dysgonomonas]EGK01707.1 hypothetical protein HMPREF9455_01855 [Dysgonomonas gadei ATCC BAA-286]MBF0648060.1 hypothetical protein [Dysgonomonas sp. GY75]